MNDPLNGPLMLGCPHCGASNRIPRSRLADGPNCGRCKQALFGAGPAELTSANFRALVERSDLPVVVDLWAGWCGPCQMMAPIFARVAHELEPGMRFAKLDTEAEPVLAGHFGVRSIPTLIVFREGREVARQAGAMPADALRSWLQPHLLMP